VKSRGKILRLQQRLENALRENRRFRERIELLASQNHHLRERYKDVRESTPEIRAFGEIASSSNTGDRSPSEPSRSNRTIALEQNLTGVFPIFENGIKPLDPSPGLRCLTSNRAPIRMGFRLFGLDGEGMEELVLKVEERQLRERDFIPVFVTDNSDFGVFRSRGYVFEFIPPSIANASNKQRSKRRILKDRLELIKAKWNLRDIVDLSG